MLMTSSDMLVMPDAAYADCEELNLINVQITVLSSVDYPIAKSPCTKGFK